MRVAFEIGARGAARAAARDDVLVVVDALRASATIIAALQAGARRVLPVRTVAEAEAYLGAPGYLVAGERGGAKPSTFDLGNSPVQIMAHSAQVADRTVVLTTSNGTRCVDAARGGAAGLLIGSTLNARAVADAAMAYATEQERDITVLAAGLDDRPAQEDTYAQTLIATRLIRRGALPLHPVKPVCEGASRAVFQGSESARRLTLLGYADDVELCARIDVWDTVPVYGADGFRALRA